MSSRGGFKSVVKACIPYRRRPRPFANLNDSFEVHLQHLNAPKAAEETVVVEEVEQVPEVEQVF